MKRRELMSSFLSGIAAGWPLAAWAERPVKMCSMQEVHEARAQLDAIALENARLLDELQKTNRQLAEASRQRLQFLSVSSEMRVPINAILGYTELILDNVYGETPENIREVLKRFERNGNQLIRLINGVFERAKSEDTGTV
jgi:signal transduction histidine kinase